MTYKEFTLISLVNMIGYDNSRWSLDFIAQKTSVKEMYLYDAPDDEYVSGLTLAIWPQDGDEEFFRRRARPTAEYSTKDGLLMLYDLNEN